jgi:hypothetical protein
LWGIEETTEVRAMTDDQTGFLIPALERISEYMKCISPMRWLGFKNPNASATEKYVLSCLMIELVIGLAFLSQISRPPFVGWVIGVLAVIRIVEIIGRTVDIKNVISPKRTVVLAAINYVELALCFGVIYALNYHGLFGVGRPITGFYFSIVTQLTIGYGDVYPMGWFLRLVAAVQGLTAALFIILVFGRVIAALPISPRQ